MAARDSTARERIDLRAEKAWISRIRRQAERLGMGLSAYIRQAVTLRLEADEAEEATRRPPKRRG